MNEPDDPWKRLVEATKTADAQDTPPPSPRLSIQALREHVYALLLTLTWRKWSLLAALVAGLIFLVIYLFVRDSASPSDPIIQPDLPLLPAAP